MTKGDQYVLGCISSWIWAGYYSVSDIEAMVDDVVDAGCDVAFLKASVKPEFEEKLQAEAGWLKATDCDRLDGVFFRLHEQGICALGNTGYEMSDGHSEVAEAVAVAPQRRYHGYCFYHGQDIEHAIAGHGMMIAFGDLSDDPVAGVRVGNAVADSLRQAGFAVVWDGAFKTRISIPSFLWQRRNTSDAK